MSVAGMLPQAGEAGSVALGGSVIIRADAGPAIGVGHLIRCLALAEELGARGYQVTLATRGEGAVLAHAARAGISRVDAMPGDEGVEEELAHLTALVRTVGAEVVVLDGYQFDQSYQRRLRQLVHTLVCVDDLAAGPFDCDLILNQNLGAQKSDYARQILADTTLLLGPAYALLRKSFRERRGRFQVREAGRRVLVTIGGADYQDVALRAVQELAELPSIHLDLVLGPAYGHADPLARLGIAAAQGTHVHRNVDRMDLLMEQTDVAISGAGSTVWELARLGVPMLLVSTKDGQGNDNQYRLGCSVADRGAAVMLGRADDLRDGEIARATLSLLDDAPRRAGLSQAAAALVDGQGASRVADALAVLQQSGRGSCHESYQDRRPAGRA